MLGVTCVLWGHILGVTAALETTLWLPPSPGCAWTCWPEGKAGLPGHSSIFPCCLRKPPATWHSQRCHLSSASLPEPTTAASTLTMAGGLLLRGEEHLQRLPVAL